MNRTSIDYGIHLGAVYCSIAVLKGNQVELIKNNENNDLTPSAVYLDKNSNLFVGRSARSRLEAEPEDAYGEFIPLLGSDKQFTFRRSGRVLRAEELAAEVIKSLRADVRQRQGEELEAAVMAVPATFGTSQRVGANEAARLAGLQTVRLIAEPMAAALAYAYQEAVQKEYWLVYSLGYLSFEACVVQAKGGAFQVVGHAVDPTLGESLIDWEIVEKWLAPAVARGNPLTDFTRHNPKWRKAFGKLRRSVEEARHQLTHQSSSLITFDFLCSDDHGEPVVFEYELKRAEVNRLIEPYLLNTAQICRKVLSANHLGTGDLAKLIYAGDPALASSACTYLEDPLHGLGMKPEDSLDPQTVFSRGAAIFAGKQVREAKGEMDGQVFQIDLPQLEIEQTPVNKPESFRQEPESPPRLLTPIEKLISLPEAPGPELCPVCQEQVETVEISEKLYCVNCGVQLLGLQRQSQEEKLKQVTSTEIRCPVCHLDIYPVHITAKFYCPECGIRLQV